MAKLYTAKVAIPGDKIGEYLELLADAEKRREPFRLHMNELNEQFYNYLLKKYSDRTANRHSTVVELFIDFVCKHTDVEKIEEITKGMVNTHFRKWWKRKVWDSTTPEQLRVALKKFFTFLATEKDIVNDKALKALLG